MSLTVSSYLKRKKLRSAELIFPPNKLRDKVGHGGLDEKMIEQAQTALETNTQSFPPIAETYLEMMTKGLQDIRARKIDGETAIEALIYPSMQLKAQGGMFKYPLISDINALLIGFLERIENVDKYAIDVVNAHIMAMKVVLANTLEDDGGSEGDALMTELKDACIRYFKTHNAP